MIKAVVLDVDGVLIGTKRGVNFPYPSEKIIETIKNLQNSGIRVSLCSANAKFGLEPLIDLMELDSLHIANNGSEIFNPRVGEYKSHPIDKEIVKFVVEKSTAQNIYTELFTSDDFYILKKNKKDFTDTLSEVRKRQVVLVDELDLVIEEKEILRLPLIVETEKKQLVENIVKQIQEKIDFKWSTTPAIPNIWIGIINPKNISKRSGITEISKYLNISFENILAVGDGINDWSFIEVCRFGGVMGNGHNELKELIKSKKENGYVGGDVDEDGLIEIFKYFKII